jgi:hypothetical protein
MTPLVFPTITTLVIISVFFALTRRRSGSLPWFELGGFYAVVVTFYTLGPIISYAIRFATDQPLGCDGRFSADPPTAEELAKVAWWQCLYLACFSAAYFVTTRKT